MRKQLQLNLSKGSHGGRRPGAGRKRIHSKGVGHRTREKVTLHTPLHINFKYKVQIRNKFCLRNLKRAIMNARKMGLKVIHFSLQHNHVHLIIETVNNEILTRGMRSLTITFAKGIQKGQIQIERYHLHVLKTIRETRNAVQYVLFNNQRHGSRVVDEYSSILQLPHAIDLIKAYVTKRKITLEIKKGDNVPLDVGTSFLIRSS